jgi:hypothetical protein
MEPILNRNDFERVLKTERAVIYVYVDWSSYAAQTGLRITEEAERHFQRTSNPEVSFWLANVSDLDSPAAFIVDWLRRQESEKMRMFPAIGTGNGSLVWLRNGRAIGFALSASHLGVDGVTAKTKEILFGQSQA